MDALLAEAVGCWRALSAPSTWTTASGWPNEGTGGAAYDLTAANEAPALGQEDGNEQAVIDANRVTPTLTADPPGFVIGFGVGDATDARDDYGFAGANGLDMSGSFTVTIDYTPTDITDDDAKSCRPLRKGGPFGHPGIIVEQVPIAFGGCILIAIGENAAPDVFDAGYVAATSTPVAGRQQATIVLDRTSHVGRFYRNGAAETASFSDETNIGDSTTTHPLILGGGNTVHNVVFHDRALTTSEVVTLQALLAADEVSSPTDVLTAAEAQAVVGLDAAHPTLPLLVSAVSDQLDELCGPIVVRTVTAELHNGGSSTVFLNLRPVDRVQSVTEYSGTNGQVLTEESNTAKSAYDFILEDGEGIVRRRSGNSDACFASGRCNVTVTYVAGRYASTAHVGSKFKEAAALMLRNLWTSEVASGSETFGSQFEVPNPLLGPGMLNKVAALLKGEMQAPAA